MIREKIAIEEDGGLGYVKGYNMQSITLKKLEKGKLGNALSEVVDMEFLEDEIRKAIKEKRPVWGYFKKGQMWSCYIFERLFIEKERINPVPENKKDILHMFKLKYEYIHPDVIQYYDKMKAGIFTGLKETTMWVDWNGKKASLDSKADGFIWGKDTYVMKGSGKSGIPIGVLFGLSVGVLYGIALDNIALGICLGIAIGSSLSIAFSAGKISKIVEPVDVLPKENAALETEQDGE